MPGAGAGPSAACGCEALAELGAGWGGRGGGGSWASARPGQARGGALLASGRPPAPLRAETHTHTHALPPDSPPPAGRVQGPARGSLAAAELAGFWSAAAGWKLRHVCESSCLPVLTGEKNRKSEGGS